MKVNVKYTAKLVSEWEELSDSDRIACKGIQIKVDREMNEYETIVWEESLLVNTMMVVAGCAIDTLRMQMDKQGMCEDMQQAMLDTLLNHINPQQTTGGGDKDILRNIPSCFVPRYPN